MSARYRNVNQLNPPHPARVPQEELVRELASRGLDAEGIKPVLVDRLLAALQAGGSASAEAPLVEPLAAFRHLAEMAPASTGDVPALTDPNAPRRSALELLRESGDKVRGMRAGYAKLLIGNCSLSVIVDRCELHE